MGCTEIIATCRDLYNDVELSGVARWKQSNNGAKAVGFMPIYIPREILHAAGVLPVGLMGGGDNVEIIKGDAYYQSYICHIPRSTIELGLGAWRETLDGLICPSICDVVRNMSGIWLMQFPEKYVKYLDFPQNFDASIGGAFYIRELTLLREEMTKLSGRTVTDEALRESIALYNENRRLSAELYDARAAKPWQFPAEEVYLLARAGNVLPVEEHNAMLADYLKTAAAEERREMDNIRVIVIGSFCEQPPLAMIKTLEQAGCYIVDDDFVLGARWLTEPVTTEGDPIEALSEAYLNHSTFNSARYEGDGARSDDLIKLYHDRKADGVIFCAASFCDPALLDQPVYQKAMDDAGIPYTAFQFHENTGQFQVIREQAGTFSDSIKLWSVV